MKKEDCRKGLVVVFGDDNCRGVVVKVNPKRAEVSTLDSHKGRRPGVIWRVPYSMMSPVVGDQMDTEMAMRSFSDPEDKAVKAWAGNHPDRGLPERLEEEDYHILTAIHILYTKLDGLNGRKRSAPSEKIHLLFRAIGREISKESVDRWTTERSAP